MNAVISKGRFEPGQGFFLSAITVGWFFFSRFLFRNAFSFPYLQIDRLIAAIIFTLLFIYIIFKGHEEYKAVDIYEEQIKVKWLFGLISIHLNKTSLSQFGRSTVKNIDYIYLKTEKYDLLFNENLIENNLELFDQLRLWHIKQRDKYPVRELSKLETKTGGVALMIAGAAMFTGIFWGSYILPITTIDTSKLTTITGHLMEEPEIDRPTLRSPSTNVTFKLKEYPAFRFNVNHPGYAAIRLDDLKKYNTGDESVLAISKNDYSKKITQTIEPDNHEKHYGWANVQTYEVVIRQESVLQLNDFNKEALALRESNQKWGFLALGLTLAVFWGGLKSYRYRRNF